MGDSINMFVIEKEINKNVSDQQKRYRAIGRILRTTTEYKACKELYNLFVCEVANFLHSLGISDSVSAVLYLDLMLRNGMLSITNKNDYHLYKNDYEYISELLGARTIGGVSVCRHMSALTADILNIEYYASWLNSKYIFSLDEIDDDSPYLHAVVGLICGEEKILYDPTASSFAAAPKDILYTQRSCARVAETFISYTNFAEQGDHILLNNSQYPVNPETKQELEAVWYAPFGKVNQPNFISSVENITKLYQETQTSISEFKENIREISEEIVALESAIHPHSDQQILKWQLNRSLF